MKKILLVGMLVVSGLSFGRDFEVREWQEQKELHQPVQMNQEMVSRDREISENNMVVYSDFHEDLDNMDRGHDDRD